MNNAKEKAQDRREEILKEATALKINCLHDSNDEHIISPRQAHEAMETYKREGIIEELENLKSQAEFFIPKTKEPPANEWARGKLSSHQSLIAALTERISELKK